MFKLSTQNVESQRNQAFPLLHNRPSITRLDEGMKRKETFLIGIQTSSSSQLQLFCFNVSDSITYAFIFFLGCSSAHLSCNYTVWPGVSSSGATALSTTGFSLEKNESKILRAPDSWTGRFWGRTYCTEDSSGNFSCITGDCGSGKLECSGSGVAPPATLAEFALGSFSGLDFYDVSLVDGFNLPLLVVPSGQNCLSTGCIGDVNESCPTELEFTTGTEGKRVGCKSACDALRLSIYCCDGTSSSPDKCKPSLYSNFYKNLCPQSYSYAYDDDTNTTYTCPSTDYQIIFCPGKSINTTGGAANNSRPPSGEITPSSMPEIRPNATSRRKWEPIIAGVVGGVLTIISFVVIVVLRVRWSKSEDTEEDEEDDHIQQVPGMPVRMLQNKAEYILGYLDEYIQSDREEIIRMLEVAAWCLQDDPERRPLMSTVVKVLEGLMEVGSNLVYKFSHALTPPPAVDAHISSAPPPASVLSNPR
ncbi:hypothetical protein SADUNF_Sadunf11G0002200 [Salix dunnii]|uniref:Uncharacterized protein n=1 Tax=Salix dunnii TaxID=1413687 RepID=A0A835JP96_9ROSI|nr:hypothetical protein SADUNF_Sadunf11G0002200 [Salix dunnii]